MEFVGQPGPSGACSLLGVPGLGAFDMDDDEGEEVIGIRPKSSPLPRRKSSVSDEDSEPEPPLCGSRRVSFADAKGLSLVQVKEFDTWDVPKLPRYEASEGEGKDKEEYFLSPLTFFPVCAEELLAKVQEEKVVLETMELLPGTTILKGVIRVLNISFNKSVFVRTTLDAWTSHFDLLAEYIPGSSDNLTDCFSFKLTLVPPFAAQGARVDFCLRYETPLGTFWANNNNKNYVLFCQKRVKEREEKEEMENANKKSCLKTAGQNFPTVENISAMEGSSGENMSTDAPTNGGQVDAMTSKKIPDGQSGTSAEKAQQAAESRQNCSRRKRRKAARVARAKDYFAQQGGTANGNEIDASPPEEKTASQEETPDEKHTGVQPVSEGGNKSEGSLCVPDFLETSCEPTIDALQDAAKAHDYTSNNEPEKSESMNADDSATLPGGERAADSIRDSPVYSNDDSAEWRNVDGPVSTAEEGSQEQDVSFECPSSTAAELADSVISAVSRESLVNDTNSFTFRTVVAPLYHQVFGRVGGETQSAGDWGNRTRAENHPCADREDTSCIAQADAGGNNGNVQGNLIKVQESQESCVHAANSPPSEEEPTDGVLDCAETHHPVMLSNQRSTDAAEGVKGISDGHLNAVNVLNTDLLDPEKNTESLHLRGEEQEDNLTRDLRSRSTVQTAQAEVPERTSTQAQSHRDETHPQNQTEEVRSSLEASSMSLQPSDGAPERFRDDAEQQTAADAANDGKCVPQISLETYEETNDGEEENKEPIISNCYIRVDMFMELSEDDDFKYEDIFVSEKIEMESRFSDAAEEKDWEMMVEEEEENILTDEEENEAMSSKEQNTEAAEKEDRQTEDAGMEAAPENKDTTEAEEEKAEDGRASAEDKHIGEIVAGKNSDESEKEFEYVEATEMEKAAGVEKLADEKEEEEEEIELENEKHFAEMQEVGIQTTEVQEEEEIVGEEEIDMNNDDESDQVEPREKNVEEENPDFKEGILSDETSVIAGAESESMTIVYRESEVVGFGAGLSITHNNTEDGLSAPLNNNVQDEGLCEKITEEENAQASNQTHPDEEETLQSGENDTHGESECAVADRGSCVFADQQEMDELSDGSEVAESDSDDEVELYMHCLRAVHAGAHKDSGFSGSKSPAFSGSRSKLLSTPMPSISESLDEEQTPGCLQDNHEDTETVDIQFTAAPPPAASEHERVNRKVSWWTETLSCSNISKTLLYATVLVLFVVVAYHYDFIACFGLYVISLIWLCCQGERQPVKNNRMGQFQ